MKINIISIVFICFVFAACEDSTTEEPIENETTIEATSDKIQQEESLSYMLPSPLQIAEIFKNSGLNFVGDLTNPKEKIASYNTKYNQKLNFGIYSADMAYCIINNQTQPAIDYLHNLKQLSEKLWMTDIFNSMGLSKRLESNIGNHDSLTIIMADLQILLDDYLVDNGMGYTGPIIFAGAWIETMYLGAEVNKTNSNEKLIYRLSEQAVVLDNLIKALTQADEDNDFTELITDLKKIDAHFDVLETNEDAVLTESQINDLSILIAQVRNKIIQ
ncbi:MAG: hypothetical protein K0B10_07655 [Vicingaceae bacterium]|nr:hypothetical protein [Vicingaceae bacterium]